MLTVQFSLVKKALFKRLEIKPKLIKNQKILRMKLATIALVSTAAALRINKRKMTEETPVLAQDGGFDVSRIVDYCDFDQNGEVHRNEL